jgi:phosphatidylserine/phosphatidylglycerophosphate/cardiolipin synthase-like enzyme
MLQARGSRFLARWDRAAAAFCQHQKSWLIDAGQCSETAFVGGINPTFMPAEPGHTAHASHAAGRQRHDIYLEVTGPSATDVHHNFVQRWNEASERGFDDGIWAHDGDARLPFPLRTSDARGDSVVQIQRNVHAGRYRERHATPAGLPYDIEAGERSITGQYLVAIKAARESIYIENQALPVPAIAYEIEQALKRGVQVVLLVPGEPEDHIGMWRKEAGRRPFFEQIEKLGQYDTFTLAGIAAPTRDGERSHVYVHAKIMLVDDEWATIGSCNLHANSLFGHSEMNAAIWDPAWVSALRCELLREHLDEDTAQMNSSTALQRFRQIARDNDARRQVGKRDWQGLAFDIDPRQYGT